VVVSFRGIPLRLNPVLAFPSYQCYLTLPPSCSNCRRVLALRERTRLVLGNPTQRKADSLKATAARTKSMKMGSLRSRPRWREGCCTLESSLAAIAAAEERATAEGRVAGAADVVALGCDSNGYDQGGFSAVHCAAKAGSVDIIKRLLKYGATGSHVTENRHKNLIHVAAAAGCLEVVQWATEGEGRDVLGLDPSAADLAGFSPFFVAIENHRPEVVKWYLEAGVASIADRSVLNKTALMIAINCPKREEVRVRGQEVLDANLSQVKYLATFPGQNIEWTCPMGQSAVFLAVYRGQPAVVYYMLDQFNVDVNQVVQQGRTLWCAFGMRATNVVRSMFSRRDEENTLMVNMARRKPFVLSSSDSRMLLKGSTLTSLNLGIKLRVQGPAAIAARSVEMVAHCPLPAVLTVIVIDYGKSTTEDLTASDGALLGDTLASTFVYERTQQEGSAPIFMDLTG
jgi:ankyrin repeat protein